jgi:hypothetical protein
MIIRFIKPILLLMCIVGLFFLPMSGVFLHNRPMDSSVKDYIRVESENVEHTDYHSSDISTFVNDHFVFYVPPPTIRSIERPSSWDGYAYTTSDYVVANLSTIQLFSYENGATVNIEWLNGTAINGTRFDCNDDEWTLSDDYTITWIEKLPQPLNIKKTVVLDEYESEEIQVNSWVVRLDYRMMSGVVRITSDYPISVMHHKLYPMGTLDEDERSLFCVRKKDIHTNRR